MAKPFSFEVLGARIRALLRRPQELLDNILVAKDVELDTVNHSVKRRERGEIVERVRYSGIPDAKQKIKL